MNLLKLGTEDQANLVKPVTKVGVYMALTSTDSYKSPPGKDIFQSFFYKTCWDVVRDGVWKFVRNASATGCFDKKIIKNSTVLIPKEEYPATTRQFSTNLIA